MKAAVIFAVPSTTSPDDCWRWRTADGAADSKKSFVHYRDCCEDARASGYCVTEVMAGRAARGPLQLRPAAGAETRAG